MYIRGLSYVLDTILYPLDTEMKDKGHNSLGVQSLVEEKDIW